MVYRDGVPLAVMEGGIVRTLAALDAPVQKRDVASALRARRATASVGLLDLRVRQGAPQLKPVGSIACAGRGRRIGSDGEMTVS